MSQASDLPILIGSCAAQLGGFLPPWRNGRVHDIDIVCSRAAADQLAARMGQPLREHAPGRAMLAGPMMIDIDIAGDERLQLLRIASGAAVRNLAPIGRFVLAPAEVIWATRIYTVGLNRERHRSAVLDALHYNALPLQLTDAHRRLAEATLRHSLAAVAYRLHNTTQQENGYAH